MFMAMATAPGHPFYRRLNGLLDKDKEKFDEFTEKECAQSYTDKNGCPSLTPGTHFRPAAARLQRGSWFST
jgi:hypothetical protein